MITRERPEVAELAELGTEPRVYHVASGVTLEDYLEIYAEQHCEYIEGEVYREMPIHIRHERIRDFLRLLFQWYFILMPIGEITGEPMVMKQAAFPNRRREPDLMIVLNNGQSTIEETQVNGAADIVIEIVSPGSFKVDHVDKFEEYEQGGVREYWLFDFMRHNVLFFRLDQGGIFRSAQPDVNGIYITPLLPRFELQVSLLWVDKLLNPAQIAQTVEAMIKE